MVYVLLFVLGVLVSIFEVSFLGGFYSLTEVYLGVALSFSFYFSSNRHKGLLLLISYALLIDLLGLEYVGLVLLSAGLPLLILFVIDYLLPWGENPIFQGILGSFALFCFYLCKYFVLGIYRGDFADQIPLESSLLGLLVTEAVYILAFLLISAFSRREEFSLYR